jgi:hypothetical protein
MQVIFQEFAYFLGIAIPRERWWNAEGSALCEFGTERVDA